MNTYANLFAIFYYQTFNLEVGNLSYETHLFQVNVMMVRWSLLLGSLAILTGTLAEDSKWGGLYPRESGSREVKSLDGLWNFRLAPLHDPLQGFREEWFLRPLSKVSARLSS